MKHTVLTALAFALVVAAGVVPAGRGAAARAARPAAQDQRTVRFVALGDGGQLRPEKLDVARKIAEVCAARGGCDFALYLGDNIYPRGAKGAYDKLFDDAFEAPFGRLHLPFYVTQGNHDNSATDVPGGDGHNNRRGDSQVEYHYRRDRAGQAWRMPARYYTERFGDVQIFSMDTAAVLEEGLGTDDPGSSKQLAWLRDGLARSTARWKFVFGHHPYVSNGAHGNAGSYRGVPEPQGTGANLKAFMEGTLCDRADFYFCGHDHHLEWLKPVALCGRTQFIVSGVASDPRALPNNNINEFYFQAGTASLFGFWLVEVEGDTLRATAYDARAAAPLFEKTVTKTTLP